jgi:hypothetical protein
MSGLNTSERIGVLIGLRRRGERGGEGDSDLLGGERHYGDDEKQKRITTKRKIY